MPEPKYLDTTTEDDLKEPSAAPVGEPRETGGKASGSRSAWMPVLCAATAGDIVRSAVVNVGNVDCGTPGVGYGRLHLPVFFYHEDPHLVMV